MATLEETLRAIVREEVRAAMREGAAAPAAPDELLTIAAAAALVDVDRSTIQRWLKAGDIAREGRGRFTRVRRSEVFARLAGPKVEASQHSVQAMADALMRRAG